MPAPAGGVTNWDVRRGSTPRPPAPRPTMPRAPTPRPGYGGMPGVNWPAVAGFDPYTYARQQPVGDLSLFTGPSQALGNLMGGNSSGGGRSGGGRGGGGGGFNRAAIQAQADKLFAFNAAPYDTARSNLETAYRFNAQPYDQMAGQVQGYNPDFRGLQDEYTRRLGNVENDRVSQIKAQIDQHLGVTNDVANAYSGAMSGAVRDLATQGANTQPFLSDVAQRGQTLTGQMGAQGGYLQALQALGAQQAADTQRGLGLAVGGSAANLAANKGQALNQIGLQRGQAETALGTQRTSALAQLAVQQAAAQQELERARREFLLRYGITG